MTRPLTERELWFRSKVGLRLFRNATSCPCGVCAHVTENGLIVADDFHADYLYDCELESNGEGIPLRYFDSIEEVNEWLKAK